MVCAEPPMRSDTSEPPRTRLFFFSSACKSAVRLALLVDEQAVPAGAALLNTKVLNDIHEGVREFS